MDVEPQKNIMDKTQFEQLCAAIRGAGHQSNREVRDEIQEHAKEVNNASTLLSEKLQLLADSINESSRQSARSSTALSRITLVMAIATVVMCVSPIIKFFL